MTLLRLGRPEGLWPMLCQRGDPSVRSYIVDRLKPLGANPATLVTALLNMPTAADESPGNGGSLMDSILFHPETSVRRSLILALGKYDGGAIATEVRGPIVAKLLEGYRDDPDAGIHGATEWTLRQWNQGDAIERVEAELKTIKDWDKRRWYLNCEGQTLSIVEAPVEFTMGTPPSASPREQDEQSHRRRIGRRFALGMKEVTVAQFYRFLEENSRLRRENPQFSGSALDRNSPEPTGPMNRTSWYDAAAYCNWLSRREGLRECYAPNAAGEFGPGMTNFADSLNRGGYRLPTEAEWEYGCRAGAVTNRYHGGSNARPGAVYLV